jgi:hypothetical protein
VTIAQRRADPLDTIAAHLPVTPPLPALLPGLPVAAHDVPAPESVAPVGRLRRCTFRRIDRLESLPGRVVMPVYEVMCLYRGMETPMAIGDVDGARSICETCTATGIFRPDEA